jgi:hypothetical protein
MIKKYLQYILSGFLLLLFSVSPAYSFYHTGYTHEGYFSVPPTLSGSPSATSFSTSCYCVIFTQWEARVVECDCTFTYRVIGLETPVESLENNGGHNHNFDTHPLIEPKEGALQTFGAAEWLDLEKRLWVEGHTLNNPLMVRHPIPQVAGRIQREIIVTAPWGWVCGGRCWTDNSWRYLDTINVGLLGFEKISDNGDYHIVVRDGKDTHPEGIYGTSDIIKKLKEIAKKYFKSTGRKLSINDISLPAGGLFDINNNWATPHIEHRTGTDADINRAGVDCHADKKLRSAVEDIAKGQQRPYLQCEDARGRPVPPDDPTGLYKHIGFD